jgi:hypothetical protein
MEGGAALIQGDAASEKSGAASARRNAAPVEGSDDAKPEAPWATSEKLSGKPEKSEKLGFPLPPAPPRYAVTEPAAVGGVVYQQLRNPRPGDGADPVLGESPTVPHPRMADRSRLGTSDGSAASDGSASRMRASDGSAGARGASDEGAGALGASGASESPPTAARTNRAPSGDQGVENRRGEHRATQPEEDTTIHQTATGAGPDVPTGRHTLPDELVRATTYRLPPDRVFRAKVPENTPLPEEPTTRLPSVPKPRDESTPID